MVDQDSHPSSAVVEEACHTEVVDPSYQAIASFLVVGIPLVASRSLVVRIVVEAFVDRNLVTTSFQAIGSPSVVADHTLAIAASLGYPSFQVVGHTWVAEEDSLAIAFLPSWVVALVIAYLVASSVAKAYHPSFLVAVAYQDTFEHTLHH